MPPEEYGSGGVGWVLVQGSSQGMIVHVLIIIFIAVTKKN
jgi:hypothetical protein